MIGECGERVMKMGVGTVGKESEGDVSSLPHSILD